MLTLTGTHFIYKTDRSVVAAADVKVGDRLIDGEDGSETDVWKLETVWENGLYNPQTMQGDIVVDGIVSSTYTQAVPQQAAHALLAPVRAAFVAFARMRQFALGVGRSVL